MNRKGGVGELGDSLKKMNMAEKYNAYNIAIEQSWNFFKSEEIAIPEIQRPFVWKPKQDRDLIDSLYIGYPTGYLIISQ